MDGQNDHPQDITPEQFSTPLSTTDASRSGLVLPNLPIQFWEARPALAHIRTAAHSRLRAADVVFYGVLTRLSAFVSPNIVVETEIATPASLNFMVATVGPSGAGKTTGTGVSALLLPKPSDLECAEYPIGSGEGLCEAYMGSVQVETGEFDRNGNPKMTSKRQQVVHNALFLVDEGESLTKQKERSAATLGPTLRSAWSGATLGQKNASDSTTRVVNNYSLGLLIGFQLDTVQSTLNEIGNGMAQRFVYSSLADPSLPDFDVADPGALSLDTGVLLAARRTLMRPEPGIVAGLKAEHRCRTRTGGMGVREQDSHNSLTKIKIAGLLALLDDRQEKITEEDWELAGIVWDTSSAVRDALLTYGKTKTDEKREAATRASASKKVAENRAVTADQARIINLARKATEFVRETPGITESATRKKFNSRYRDDVPAAIAYAETQGWIESDELVLRPGTSRPAL